MSEKGRGATRTRTKRSSDAPGIVIADRRQSEESEHRPTIAAFIWGGKVRPTPTLPFGRWKGAA